MDEPHVFGTRSPHITYALRRAAYVVVVLDRQGRVATVRAAGKHFPQGGGSPPCEPAEAAVAREVREEPGRGVRVGRRIGEAIQYFYSPADRAHYEMSAAFFAGEFAAGGGGAGGAVPGPCRLDAGAACFHECHAWAVGRA